MTARTELRTARSRLDELDDESETAPGGDSTAATLTATRLASRAEFWRSRYEETRERLAKLWLAFKDAEVELRELKEGRSDGAPADDRPSAAAGPPTVTVPVRVFYEEAVKARSQEPFRHEDYTLYTRQVRLKGGRDQQIYFFGRHPPKRAQAVPMPEGYVMEVSRRTGLPFLRKSDHPAPEDVHPKLEPQCEALTAAGTQCRNSSRHGSKYCASHEGYHPPSPAAVLAKVDTAPRDGQARDTTPATRGRPSTQAAPVSTASELVQCAAVTTGGKQCKNSARLGSRYCAAHRGYQPRTVKGLVEAQDTSPRTRGAPDTLPVLRKT